MATFRRVYARLVRYFSHEHHVFDNTILALVVSTLLSILQLRSVSPFDTHPIAVFMAAASVLMYGVSCDVEKRYDQTNVVVVNIARHAKQIFASLLVASLISILVPSFFQPIVFIALMMFYACQWIVWLHEEIMDANEDEVQGTDIV